MKVYIINKMDDGSIYGVFSSFEKSIITFIGECRSGKIEIEKHKDDDRLHIKKGNDVYVIKTMDVE